MVLAKVHLRPCLSPQWIISMRMKSRTDRNLELLKRARKKGYFIRCYYILTADPMINVFRVRARVEAGGHDVPEDKISSRFDKTLALVHEVVAVCDICHIYDNSEDRPYRIYKKRKGQSFYDVCDDRNKEDIVLLTLDRNAEKKTLNKN